MDEIQELIDSIYNNTLTIENEPLGKKTHSYPGAKPEYDDKEYITNKPLSNYSSRLQQPIENEDIVREQEEDTEDIEDEPADSDMPDVDVGGEEEDYNISEIGRIYEVKKIFSRLISLESFLTECNDEVLIKLSVYSREAIELFKLVVNNMDKFIEEIDEIIIIFYEFLKISYNLLHKYYDKLDLEDSKKETK